MGCDIHAFVELKINDEWHLYNHPDVDRDYQMFARMAGVRNYGGTEPISLPRGLPDDVSCMVALENKFWGGDDHSHSYLTREELIEFGGIFGFVFGYYPDELEEIPKEIEDLRLVFWFDN